VVLYQNETEALLLSQITGITGVGGTVSIAQTIEAVKNSSPGTSGSASDATARDSEYQTILAKANSGRQLTSAELSILQEKNPAAYARAMRTNTASPAKSDQVVISYREQ
jgi:hypothetical protein